MPYRTTAELPDSVKNNLPQKAQEIYMEAYNSAWDRYDKPEERRGDATREDTAHKVAWAAVKQKYEKQGDRWVQKREAA
ncbi:MAG: ChaB family protein [Chloroflexi bacterium]|nr:ChaB family protein [Chloroflexota bacterium]